MLHRFQKFAISSTSIWNLSVHDLSQILLAAGSGLIIPQKYIWFSSKLSYGPPLPQTGARVLMTTLLAVMHAS